MNLHTKNDHRSFYSLTIMSLFEDNNERMSVVIYSSVNLLYIYEQYPSDVMLT